VGIIQFIRDLNRLAATVTYLGWTDQ